jgi:hypothetical protein
MSGPCGGKNWAPSDWKPGVNQVYASKYWYGLHHWIRWNSTNLQNLKNLNADYHYEMRRSKNYWHFLILRFSFWRGFYCTCEYATNLPNPDPWWSEESDWWAIYCLNSMVPQDEEAELVIYKNDVKKLQADRDYYVYMKFYRASRGKTFTLTTKSEYCKDFLCLGGFDWCEMTSESRQS